MRSEASYIALLELHLSIITHIFQQNARTKLGKAGKTARSGRVGGFTIGKKIFRTKSIEGLFRGDALRSAWTALGSGLYLDVYESSRTYLDSRRDA